MEHEGQLEDRLHYCELAETCGRIGVQLTCQAPSLDDASKVRVIPRKGKGKGQIVPLDSKVVSWCLRKQISTEKLTVRLPVRNSPHIRSSTKETPMSTTVRPSRPISYVAR